MYLTGVICTPGFPRVGVPLQEPWLCPGPSLSPGTAFAPPPRPPRAVWGPRGRTEGEEARGPPCRLRPLGRAAGSRYPYGCRSRPHFPSQLLSVTKPRGLEHAGRLCLAGSRGFHRQASSYLYPSQAFFEPHARGHVLTAISFSRYCQRKLNSSPFPVLGCLGLHCLGQGLSSLPRGL